MFDRTGIYRRDIDVKAVVPNRALEKPIAEGISWFGCDVDQKNFFGARRYFNRKLLKSRVLVIPTDEELVIARDVER